MNTRLSLSFWRRCPIFFVDPKVHSNAVRQLSVSKRLCASATLQKPKRPASAWIYFLRDFKVQLAEQGVKQAGKDVMSEASAAWKSMDEAAKKKYKDIHLAEKKTFAEGLVEYNTSASEAESTTIPRPTRPITAFQRYLQHLQNTPDATVKDANLSAWATLPAEEKQPFEEAYAKDMEVYKAEKKAYREARSQAGDNTQKETQKVAKATGPQRSKVIRDPEKPTRPASAWIRFLRDFRERHKLEGSKLGAKEVMTLASAEWKSMDAVSKQPFVAPYAEEKEAYDKIMNEYKVKAISLQTDPDRPKPPQSALFRYLEAFKKALPSLKASECMKLGQESWKDLAPEQKLEYEQAAAKDMEAYKIALKAYKDSGKADAWKLKKQEVKQGSRTSTSASTTSEPSTEIISATTPSDSTPSSKSKNGPSTRNIDVIAPPPPTIVSKPDAGTGRTASKVSTVVADETKDAVTTPKHNTAQKKETGVTAQLRNLAKLRV